MTVVACGRNIVPVHQGGSWRKGARVSMPQPLIAWLAHRQCKASLRR